MTVADDEPGIDPRFAPEFQRGFAGEPSSVIAEPVAPSAVAPPPESLRVIAARAVAGPRDEEQPAEERPRVGAAPRAEWTLLGVGVATLLVALSLFWHNATDVASYTTNATDLLDYVWRDTRNLLPGPLFVGGFVAIGAWILVRSLRTAGER